MGKINLHHVSSVIYFGGLVMLLHIFMFLTPRIAFNRLHDLVFALAIRVALAFALAT